MLQHIREFYRNDNIDKLNYAIMNREFEKELVEYVIDCFKSISYVLKEIELVHSEYTIDENEINQSEYEMTRSNRKKDQEQKYTFINESRQGELKMYFKVTLPDNTTLNYTVKMLIPVHDDDQYYQIKGKKYISQYQLVETSTYSTNSAITLKSLMPVSIRRDVVTREDINGDEYKMHCYSIYIFNRATNIFYFFLSTYGWDQTLHYFSLDKYMSLVEEVLNDVEEYTYFKINNNIYLKVRTITLANNYIQGMIGTLLSPLPVPVGLLTRKMSLENIKSKEYWVDRLGSTRTTANKASHKDMGENCIILFNRMLDESTKGVLRLTERNKSNIYAVVRWMVQNYDVLKKKDNLDLLNKRLRCNEYIASLLNGIISDKIKTFVHRPVSLEVQVRDEKDRPKKEKEARDKLIKKYDTLFNYRGSEIITKLHSSGLIKFDDTVNDSDMFNKLKITTKGPNSLGNKNSKNVSSKYRASDTSHIGRLDLNFCSSSDPGLTNYITPMCKTEGLYFEGVTPEPEEFGYNLRTELDGLDISEDIIQIDPVAYNDVLEYISGVVMKAYDIQENYESEGDK